MQERSSAIAMDGLVEVLGGKRVFKRALKSEEDMVSLVRRGLPYKSFASLLEIMELEPEFAPMYLGITKRTLQRRKQQEKLDALESDRVLRLAQVLVKSTEIFKDRPSALEWLRAENVNLSGKKPLDCLDTEIGERQVMDLLGRIEYGVYS